MREIEIKQESIRLDQLLKWAGVAMTGGEAKALTQDGMIKVNGKIEKKRGRKILPGDKVVLPDGEVLTVFFRGGKNFVSRED
jgi:ribosome-associated protein